MGQLLKKSETWRVNTEKEALDMISEAKEKQLTESYNIKSSKYTLHTKKSKGEIIDAYYTVDINFTYEE